MLKERYWINGLNKLKSGVDVIGLCVAFAEEGYWIIGLNKLRSGVDVTGLCVAFAEGRVLDNWTE